MTATAPPLEPDAPEARDWLVEELSDPEYRGAEPTWFDRLFESIGEWFSSLRFAPGEAGAGPGLIVLAAVVIAGLAIAFLIYGLPRINRRSAQRGALFGEEDDRDAAAIRRAAESAAAAGDWGLAIAEMFRSIARSLADRTIVMTFPGTTAREFGARAGAVFPDHRDRLASAARAFDEVRYLGRPGSKETFDDIRSLERELRSTRPQQLEGVRS